MKLYYFLITTTALLDQSQGLNSRNSSSRRLEENNDTITKIEFTTTTGACNYDALKAALANDCPACDLNKLLTGRSNRQTQAAQKVTTLCHDAIKNNSNPNANRRGTAYPFSSITGEGVQFDKEFFDGNTPLNVEYEPVAIKASQGGANIESVYNDVAEEKLISFPEYVKDNFVHNCHAQSIMCCWVQDRQAGDDNGNCNDNDCYDKDPADNTDVCYVDLAAGAKSNHVEGGIALFPGDSATTGEGDAHCHGFAWPNDTNSPEFRYRGNALFYVSMYDHLNNRGYVGNVPGAPMCSCIDKSPTVSRADCTNVEVVETFTFEAEKNQNNINRIKRATISKADITFNNCPTSQGNNDLGEWYDETIKAKRSSQKADAIFDEHIVEDCDSGDHYANFLDRKGYKEISA